MNYLAISDTSTHSGNVISSDTYVYSISYNAVQIHLRVNSERDFPQNALISHHSYVPHIDFVVVLFSFHDLWRVVQRAP